MFVGGFQSIDFSQLDILKNLHKPFKFAFDHDNSYDNQLYTNYARCAISFLVLNIMNLSPGDEVLLPDYLCGSIVSAIKHCGVKYKFYRVTKNFELDIHDITKKITESSKAIYIIHYFGIPHSVETVLSLLNLKVKYNIHLIEDITQVMFSSDSEKVGFSDYLVCSLRKCLPIPNGAILALRASEDYHVDLPMLPHKYDESAFYELLKMSAYEFACRNNSGFEAYKQLHAKARLLKNNNYEPSGMADVSHSIINTIDIDSIIAQRRHNYEFLYTLIYEKTSFKVLSQPMHFFNNNVPYGMLLYTENQDSVSKYLAVNGIFGEIQWGIDTSSSVGSDARWLATHNIMLQCDQRYTDNTMRYIAKVLEDYCMNTSQ